MPSSILVRPGLRWAVPGGVIAAVVGAAVLVPVFADSEADLPERSAAEVITEMTAAEPRPVSGTLVHTADAGIPEIPGLTSQNGGVGSRAGLMSSVLSGSTTVRVWYSDIEHVRLAVQDDLVENDIIRNGDDLWVWSSADNNAMHLDLSMPGVDDVADMAEYAQEAHATPPTPRAITDEMLNNIEHTDISVGASTIVAGRDAYELVIEPTGDGTLIEEIRLAVDGEYFEPLRVQVFSTSDTDEPSVEIGYTSVTFSEPDASVYDFSPPEGATVEEFDPRSWMSKHDDMSDKLGDLGGRPELVGEGWQTVAIIPNVSLDNLTSMATGEGASGLSDLLMSQLDQVSGPYGTGVAFQTDLFSALLLDDGRLLVGAVTVETLEQAAAE